MKKIVIIIGFIAITCPVFAQGILTPDKIHIGDISQIPTYYDGPVKILTNNNLSGGAIIVKNPLSNKNSGITLISHNDLSFSIYLGGPNRPDTLQKNAVMLVSRSNDSTTGDEIEKFIIGNIDNEAPVIFIQNNEEVFRIDEEGNIILSKFNSGIVMKAPNGQMWKGTIDNSGHLSFSPYSYTAVNSTDNTINSFKLNQNYPNPFNQNTTISYQIPKAGLVSLDIYNNLGQKIKSLINSNQMAGEFTTEWDGCDNFSNKVATGTYFFKLSIDGEVKTNKMLLVK